jgi:hypothetical protein
MTSQGAGQAVRRGWATMSSLATNWSAPTRPGTTSWPRSTSAKDGVGPVRRLRPRPLRWTGPAEHWGSACYLESRDGYEGPILPTGSYRHSRRSPRLGLRPVSQRPLSMDRTAPVGRHLVHRKNFRVNH